MCEGWVCKKPKNFAKNINWASIVHIYTESFSDLIDASGGYSTVGHLGRGWGGA